MQYPELWSRWIHTSGNVYRVTTIANAHSTDQQRYPVTVVYEDAKGNIWSRPFSDWHRSMTEIKEQP
jgi:hypothetical protein